MLRTDWQSNEAIGQGFASEFSWENFRPKFEEEIEEHQISVKMEKKFTNTQIGVNLTKTLEADNICSN